VVKESNVYYGGLNFRSIKFNETGQIKPGESKTIEFTADMTFIITSYLPFSGVKKGDFRVEVR